MSAHTPAYVAPRTFGDLKYGPNPRCPHSGATCSFCKRNHFDDGFEGARSYSTRHYICDPCIEQRRDVVLPAVAKRERFVAAMAKLSNGARA